jgi:hypothetical protein
MTCISIRGPRAGPCRRRRSSRMISRSSLIPHKRYCSIFNSPRAKARARFCYGKGRNCSIHECSVNKGGASTPHLSAFHNLRKYRRLHRSGGYVPLKFFPLTAHLLRIGAGFSGDLLVWFVGIVVFAASPGDVPVYAQRRASMPEDNEVADPATVEDNALHNELERRRHDASHSLRTVVAPRCRSTSRRRCATEIKRQFP